MSYEDTRVPRHSAAMQRQRHLDAVAAEREVQICDTSDFDMEPQRLACGLGREKGIQVLSSWSTTRTLTTTATPDFMSFRLIESPVVQEEERWECAMWGYELTRQTLAGVGVPAQQVSLIETDGRHYSRCKARARFYNSSGGTIRDFDIAQGVRFSLVACMVTIDLLYPTGGIVNPLLRRQDDELPTATGMVIDSLIGASIKPAYGAPGSQILTNTITYVFEAGDANDLILIPPGTRWITIYQTRAGAVIDPFYRNDFALIGANIGAIILGADRRIDRMSRPGDAVAIDLGPADQQNVRVVTIVFELEI